LLLIGGDADGGDDVQGSKLLGMILLILGVLALAYGGFTYTEVEEKARVGPLKIEVEDKERVNIPSGSASRARWAARRCS
jgi:hypothetical protein